MKRKLKMFDQLGTNKAFKHKKSFPDAGNHVMTSYITNHNYNDITIEILKFLKKVSIP